MSETISSAKQARTRQLVWPREHGAWGMLLVPLATGAWIGIRNGGSASQVVLFTMATMAVFCLRTPVESLMGTSAMKVANRAERAVAVRYAILFAVLSSVTLGALFWKGRNTGLLLLGSAAALMFLAQMASKRFGRKTRMASQVVGALALTATAPGAYYVATGRFGVTALGLWFANWVFAGNQIHFVQLRLHASRCGTWEEKLARGRGFFLGQIVMIFSLAWAWAFGIVPGLVLLAFVPAFIRGTIWFFSRPAPLVLSRLGFAELAHAITFGTLLALALH